MQDRPPAHSGPKRFSLTVPALFEYCFGIPQEGSPRRQNAAFLSLCAQLISWMSGGTGIRGRLRIYSERLRVRVPPHPPPVPLFSPRPVAPLPTRAALRAPTRTPSPRTPARAPSPRTPPVPRRRAQHSCGLAVGRDVPIAPPRPRRPPRVPLPVPRGCGPVAVGRDVPIAPPRHRRGARLGK